MQSGHCYALHSSCYLSSIQADLDLKNSKYILQALQLQLSVISSMTGDTHLEFGAFGLICFPVCRSNRLSKTQYYSTRIFEIHVFNCIDDKILLHNIWPCTIINAIMYNVSNLVIFYWSSDNAVNEQYTYL